MATKQIRVHLDHEDCTLIERLYYEYCGARDIIGFLMTRDDINEAKLQEYINIAEKRFAECEVNKAQVDAHYRPEGINPIQYEFDFIKEDLVYTVNE